MRERLLTTRSKLIGLILLILLFILSLYMSIQVGQQHVAWHVMFDALREYDATNADHVILYHRVSRAASAILIGLSLAVSGAMLQALTRNPLASPGVFGINAGALFFVVVAISFFSIQALTSLFWFAFAGALLAAVLVYVLGTVGDKGFSPVRVVLAGTAINALFVSFTQGMLVTNEANLDRVLLWMAGTVANRPIEVLMPVIPIVCVALILALLIAKPMNLLHTGDEIAKGLGQRVLALKMMIILVAVMLAGGAVAVGGMIGFVGLIVPHIARFFVGHQHMWLILYCVFIGAILMLNADVVGRIAIQPREIPIGVVTALIGTPFFIYIARKGFKQS
ncbi:FecCD family ABC transporter permease [Geomicrobium sediminis]|uniref:Iron complex transport system permease protein n=1 Tax=Geomicrobium sediminis TaxID=1347788 RepID=A0ABS2PI01_9BACL|nr:iron ABC transporter permease [Geomicrobium sediminis]MBM7634907.1 iron complex transport system permease protein [Geomicrobium sediminis]